VKITLEQLSDAINNYRAEVRRSVGHNRSMDDTRKLIREAAERLREKLKVFGLADLIDWSRTDQDVWEVREWEGWRECSLCGTRKPVEDFSGMFDGSQCRDCRKWP